MPRLHQCTHDRRQDSARIQRTVIVKPQEQKSRTLMRGIPGMVGNRLMSRSTWAAVTLLMCSWMGQGLALEQKYCSSQNTADIELGYAKYQSNGNCHDLCLARGYSLAIVQFHDCWCTDYIPHPSNNREDCNIGCPGYNVEQCGNPNSGSFGYVEIFRKTPKGTAPADNKSSTVSDSDDPTSTPPPTSASTSAKVSTTPVSKSVLTTTIYIQTTTDSPPTSTPTDSTIPSIVTVTDGVKTIIYTPTDGANSPSETSAVPTEVASSGGFFSSAGRVAAVFTVLALVIIGALLFLFFFLRRRRQQGSTQLSADSPTPPAMTGVISSGEKRRSRSLSTLGLAGGGSSDKQVPTINATPTSLNKSGSAAMKGGLTTTASITPDRLTDQRLDPNQVWLRFENDHASRMSIRSLRDDTDYSRRVLRLANPDDD